jgi:hypothetical protein
MHKMKHAPPDETITATVTQLTFYGFGGAASNEGIITITTADTTQAPYIVRLGGPDDAAGDMPAEIKEYMRRVNAIYKSYNFNALTSITLRYGPSLPTITDIA